MGARDAGGAGEHGLSGRVWGCAVEVLPEANREYVDSLPGLAAGLAADWGAVLYRRGNSAHRLLRHRLCTI